MLVLIVGGPKTGAVLVGQLLSLLLAAGGHPTDIPSYRRACWTPGVSRGGLVTLQPEVLRRVLPMVAGSGVSILRAREGLTPEVQQQVAAGDILPLVLTRENAAVAGAMLRHGRHSRALADPQCRSFGHLTTAAQVERVPERNADRVASWMDMPGTLTLQYETLLADPAKALQPILARLAELLPDLDIASLPAVGQVLLQRLTSGVEMGTAGPGVYCGLTYGSATVSAVSDSVPRRATLSMPVTPARWEVLASAPALAHGGVSLVPNGMTNARDVARWEVSLPEAGTSSAPADRMPTEWRAGQRVEIEPVSVLGDDLGGQLSLGQPDGEAVLIERRQFGTRQRLRFRLCPAGRGDSGDPSALQDHVASGCAVLIDGISLTSTGLCSDGEFNVHVKEFTLQNTQIGLWHVGRRVAIEGDLLAGDFFAPALRSETI